MNSYFLWLDDQQDGPLSLKELVELWNDAVIDSRTFYWREGMDQWEPLGSFVELHFERENRTRQRAKDFDSWKQHSLQDWLEGQDPMILIRYPAQELYSPTKEPEEIDWQSIWIQHGGNLYHGRMIAKKNSPIWKSISAFGDPYPPFAYDSDMDVRDIARDEAEKLGVIANNEMPCDKQGRPIKKPVIEWKKGTSKDDLRKLLD